MLITAAEHITINSRHFTSEFKRGGVHSVEVVGFNHAENMFDLRDAGAGNPDAARRGSPGQVGGCVELPQSLRFDPQTGFTVEETLDS